MDFSKLPRPLAKVKSIDPIDIFNKTPNSPDALNALWDGQAAALKEWHAKFREASDTQVLLNTGAGKTVVGLLIAQSLVNEGIGPVLYACGTIDLIQQTSRECQKLGLKYTTRQDGRFSNDDFQTGDAFCLTTYQALFTPKSTFSGEKAPRAIIFDDAHVAEKLIRDSFTLRIDRAGHPELYSEIVDAVRPEFESIKRTEHLDFVVDSEGPGSIALCPPASAFNHAAEIITALKKAEYGKHKELKFATIQLFEHIKFCAIMISSRYLEIAPPFIPAFHFDFLGEGTRRIYLSATLDNETDFARAFGRRAVNRIEPANDAGNGERLILLDSLIKARPKKVALAKALIKKHKLLIAVPSGRVAREWSDIGRAPERSEFSSKLQAFRENKSGSFILVSRVDGIDLPHDTCRVMIIDGSPMGSSLLERYQYDLKMGNLLSSKMASRITQLFGRINRARSDFGCFLIYNSDLNVWLKTDRNIALLPPLLRKQLVLGRAVQEGSGEGEGAVLSLIGSVLDRNTGWMEYYRDSIDNLELDESLREQVRKRELQMSIAAVAECHFMSSLWVGDTIAARRYLTDVLEEVSQYDAKLAGWYSL
jgi:hypothetical protein